MKYIIQRNKGKVVFQELHSESDITHLDSEEEKRNLLEDAYAILDKHPRVQEIIINDNVFSI